MAKQPPKKAAKTAKTLTAEEQSPEVEETAVNEQQTVSSGIDPHTMALRMEKARHVRIDALIRREPFVKELVRENEEMRSELIRLAAK